MSVQARTGSTHGRRRRSRGTAAGVALATLFAILAGPAVASADPWPSDGANQFNTRYSSRGLSASKAQVPTKIWSRTFDAKDGEVLGTPLIAENGLVYVGTTTGQVMAFVRESGQVYWQRSAAGPKPAPIYNSLLLAKGRLWALVSQNRANFIAEMDPLTGEILSSTVVNRSPDVEVFGGLNYSPQSDLIFIPFCACKAEQERRSSNVRGAVAAFDPNQRELRWITGTALAAGGSVWGTPLVLDQLNRVYVATGHGLRELKAPRGVEAPADPYTDAILALDQTTGLIVDSYQATEGDVSPNDDPDQTEKRGFRAPLNASTGIGVINVGAGARDGRYHAVDAINLEPPRGYPVLVGVGSSNGGVNAAAAFDGRQISGRSGLPGVVWGIQSRTGTLSAIFPTQSPLAYGPVSVGSRVLWYTDEAGFLNAADAGTGRPIGRYPLGAPSTAGVALGKFRAVVGIGTGRGTPGGIAVFK